MTDFQARTLEVPLEFLKAPASDARGYRAEINADLPESGENPEKVSESSRTVKATDKLAIPMVSGGGMVARFVPEP